jgi:transcriptional regulator with XRE-family HTH domain
MPRVTQSREVNKGDAAYQRSYQAFLKRLIKTRRDAGLLQEVVSAKLGKSRTFLSKCELGERRLDVIELQQIAKIYGKTVNHFLGED